MKTVKKEIKEKHKIYILLLFAIYSEIGYSLLAPLYPMEAKERGVNTTMLGIIFASFGLSNFVFTILTPNLIKKKGKKYLLYLSLILEGISTIFFGLINYISYKLIFIIISFILRFIQGISSAIIQTLLYSIVASVSSKENIERNIGYIELADSIGLALGPLFASICYYYIPGFITPFLISGIFEFSGIFLIDYLEINENEEIQNSDKNVKNGVNGKEINNINLLYTLSNKYVLLIFLAVIFDELSLSFIYPVFSVYLKNKYKINPEKSSLFFVMGNVSYFLTVQVIGRIIKKIGNINSIILGAFLNSFFIIFLGPISSLPQKISLVIFGLLGIGMSGAFISIPAVIETIVILNEKMGLEKSDAENYSSALFNMGFNIGETLGTLIGGLITEKYNFSFSCIIISLINLIFGLTFLGILFLSKKLKKVTYKTIQKSQEIQQIEII